MNQMTLCSTCGEPVIDRGATKSFCSQKCSLQLIKRTDPMTNEKEQKPIYIDVRERSQGDGGMHHYIIQMGDTKKICEVFSPASKELILNALNYRTESTHQAELEKLNQELVGALEKIASYEPIVAESKDGKIVGNIFEVMFARQALQRHANLKKEV